jgi:hypothetical protein
MTLGYPCFDFCRLQDTIMVRDVDETREYRMTTANNNQLFYQYLFINFLKDLTQTDTLIEDLCTWSYDRKSTV